MVAAADDKISDEEVAAIEKAACPTCGSCSGMFTANSMNCLTEALGLSLPGNGSTLATHSDRKRLFVVVTGGAQGIGRAIVDRFAAEGATVVIGDLTDPGNLFPESDAAGHREWTPLDVTNEISILEFAESVAAVHGGVDVLVNNAGVMACPLGRTADGFEMQFGTNHLGHFALTGLLLDMVMKTPGGRVVNVYIDRKHEYIDGKVVEMYDYYDSAPITAAIAEIFLHESKVITTGGVEVTQESLDDGAIHLKDIQFKYPTRDDIKVIQNVEIQVPKNKTVALVGSSGCGKSTII